jgi:hypothetical protein
MKEPSTEALPISCPSCSRSLVSPISCSCGHTVCISCDQYLFACSGICDGCSSRLTSKRQINRMLESFIQKHYKHYCSKKTYIDDALSRTEESIKYDIVNKYKLSTRYHNLQDKIEDVVGSNRRILKDCLISVIRDTNQCSIEEIDYILHTEQIVGSHYSLITSNQWIISCYEEALIFLQEHKAVLNDDEKRRIFLHFSPRFRKMLAVSSEEKYKPTQISRDIFERLVLQLQEISLTPYNSDDSDSDSGSDDDLIESSVSSDSYESDETDDSDDSTEAIEEPS